MQNQIIAKLTKFLGKPLSEECHVVYFHVESRKLLDHERSRTGEDYLMLRFYCDWALHTSKDRMTREVRGIIVAIRDEIATADRNGRSDLPSMSPTLVQFLDMAHLKEEVHRFLDSNGLLLDHVIGAWPRFVTLLARVLEEQPIAAPVEGITSLSFSENGAERCVVIEFDGGRTIVFPLTAFAE
jgi:hypothetical protein